MAGGAALALVAGLLALPEPAAGRLPLAQPSGSTVAASTVAGEPGVQRIIPKPVQAHNTGAAPFVLDPHSRIVAHGNAKAVGNYLSGLLRPATGHQLPTTSAQPKHGDVLLDLGPGKGPAGHTAEGYKLTTDSRNAVIAADTPAGLFNGVQTLRQLFDQWIGSPVRTDGPWTAAAVQITDYPRFGYRGSMLDVARSVLTPDEVKRYIDAIAQFKANTSHLHLADDQAWRPVARHRARAPRLLHQGRVPLDRRVRRFPVRHRRTGDRRPGPGERRARVDRAAQPDGQTKPMNNTADVGYSTLQAHSPVTYEFLSTVWSQLAEMTPGP